MEKAFTFKYVRVANYHGQLSVTNLFRYIRPFDTFGEDLAVITCFVRAIFGVNHPRDSWKFWNCPRFNRVISKFSKMHSGNLYQISLPNLWLLLQILLFYHQGVGSILLSVYNSDIVWFCRFCLSSILKKVFEHLPSCNFHLMLAWSLAPFACLFFNW